MIVKRRPFEQFERPFYAIRPFARANEIYFDARSQFFYGGFGFAGGKERVLRRRREYGYFIWHNYAKNGPNSRDINYTYAIYAKEERKNVEK